MENKDYGWPTTRTFPRTMREAWPQDYLDWWEPHYTTPPSWSDIALYTCTVFILWILAKVWG